MSGQTGLDARSLAIVRELWQCPMRRPAAAISPPDASFATTFWWNSLGGKPPTRSESAPPAGMDRGDLLRRAGRHRRGDPAGAVAAGGAVPGAAAARHVAPAFGSRAVPLCGPREHLPPGAGRRRNPWEGQNDIRDLIAFRTNQGGDGRRPPRLARGMAERFSSAASFEDLLAGKASIRVVDPESDHPLRIEA